MLRWTEHNSGHGGSTHRLHQKHTSKSGRRPVDDTGNIHWGSR